MNRVRVLAALAATTAALLLAGPASAQATRTWVSGTGSDSNPCSRASPCQTFAAAILLTAASGEIDCLDPGGFGAVTITKSITISCDADTAGVQVSGTDGIVVQAGPNDVVVLSGLDIEGFGPPAASLNGVKILSAGSVTIEHCVIGGFDSTDGTDGNGVFVDLSAPFTTTNVVVYDTEIVNSARDGILEMASGGATGNVSIRQVFVSGSGSDGIALDATSAGTATQKVAISDTQSAHNGRNGFFDTSSGAVAAMTIDSSTTSDNATGIVAVGSGAGVLFSDTSNTENVTGVSQTGGGRAFSYQNNLLDGNSGSNGSYATAPLH